MREWLVIESAYKNCVFASDDKRKPAGYIPRDAAERLLGRDLGGTVWFTRDESTRMHAHAEWRDTITGTISNGQHHEFEMCSELRMLW